MKTLLLIAGRSKRFWPLTEKTLFPLCGTNLLDVQLQHLAEAGCDDIIVIGGRHNLAVLTKNYAHLNAVEQKDLDLGMRGALLDSLPQCGDEPVMIVCVNDIIDPAAYAKLIETAKNADGALLAQKVSRYFPGGYLEVNGDRVTSIVEKPGEGNEPSDLVNIVAHIHRDPRKLLEILESIPAGSDDGYEQALDTLFKEKDYRAVTYDGVWRAVKYPWHLLPLMEHFLSFISESDIHPTAEVHPTAVIDGPVILSEGVKVMPHATVRGPCYVGPHTVIANNALVRNSSIGPKCVVGYNTEVKNSILAGNVWTHMSYIGDSVIGENVSFGGGSMTGNLRLDEGEISSKVGDDSVATGLTKFGTVVGDGCRFGVHTTINPGVKIGANTFVASKTLLETDVPANMFVRTKDGVVIQKDNIQSAPTAQEREKYYGKI